MLIRPRVMALCAAVCVLAPMTLASAAQAYRGHEHSLATVLCRPSR